MWREVDAYVRRVGGGAGGGVDGWVSVGGGCFEFCCLLSSASAWASV